MHARISFQRRHNQTLRKLFRKIDADNNGVISRDVSVSPHQELKAYIDHCKMFDDKEEAAEYIFEKCDENQDGFIDFEEFRHIISAVQRQKEELPTNQELLFAFQQFDADGNQLVSLKEFWKQVKSLDASISRKEAESIFKQIDEDGDGYIDFGEFVRYLDFSHS